MIERYVSEQCNVKQGYISTLGNVIEGQKALYNGG